MQRTNLSSRNQNSIWDEILTGKYLKPVFYLAFIVFVLVLTYYIMTRYGHWVPALLEYAIPALTAFLFMLIFTPLMMFTAKRFKIVDKSEYRIKRNLPLIPLLGGVAVFLSFFLTCMIFNKGDLKTGSILFASAVMVILGTIDDIHPLSSTIRLAGQIIATGVIMASGIIVSFTPDNLIGLILANVITIFWVLGVVNATNFVDGIDGLASGFTMVAAIFFFLISLHIEQFEVAFISIVLVGCCAGFLIFNFKPAKIYLGDGGSTFMGFMLASIALYGGWSDRGPFIALGIPILILGVLIFDMIYITVSRIRNGKVRTLKEWLDYRGRDHFHHRLMNLGLDERYAVIFICLIGVVLGFSALVIEHAKMSYPVVLLLMQAMLIFIIITILMLVGRKRVDGEERRVL